MANIFAISDTHFSHTNAWEKFKLPNGDPLRPFTSTEEMDETMVERWNAKVKPGDHVYHLGDCAISKRGLEIVRRLNGKKRLVRGNHDIHSDKFYRDIGFEKIYGVRVFVDRFVMSHIPLHPDCVTDRFKVNLHGHLHGNEVMRWVKDTSNIIGVKLDDGSNIYNTKEEIDPRYLSVCVEKTNYEPLSFEEIDARIKARWEAVGYEGPKHAWGNGRGPG